MTDPLYEEQISALRDPHKASDSVSWWLVYTGLLQDDSESIERSEIGDAVLATLDAERARREAAEAEVARLRSAATAANDEICQVLGQALGYPRFCDDQQNFPGTTTESGVCVGEHVAESIAAEAARTIRELLTERSRADTTAAIL